MGIIFRERSNSLHFNLQTAFYFKMYDIYEKLKVFRTFFIFKCKKFRRTITKVKGADFWRSGYTLQKCMKFCSQILIFVPHFYWICNIFALCVMFLVLIPHFCWICNIFAHFCRMWNISSTLSNILYKPAEVQWSICLDASPFAEQGKHLLIKKSKARNIFQATYP